MWRASCTPTSRIPASWISDRQSAQSSRESTGAPSGVQKDQIPVLARPRPSREALRGLLAAVGAELGDERGR